MYLNLCPQELAGINTKQNRHQLEIINKNGVYQSKCSKGL